MTDKKSQIDKFKEAALELETDDSEAAFDEKLKKVAKAPNLDPSLSKKKSASS